MLPEGIQSEMGLHISEVHSWQGIKILILLQLLKSGCSFSPQKWNTMVMIKLVQTSMCQTCGRVRCLMPDVYRVMQLLVDKAVTHFCKPDVFKLQKILSLFYYPLCNTLRIQDAVLWTIFFYDKIWQWLSSCYLKIMAHHSEQCFLCFLGTPFGWMPSSIFSHLLLLL